MYKRFRNTVEKIITEFSNEGLEKFYEAEQKVIKVEMDNFLPFTVEKNGDFLYIGYYRNVNGDAISDPVFVFQLKNNAWYPLWVEQVFGDTKIGEFRGESYYYSKRNFDDVRSFATTCAKEWKAYYL